jgi:hypothetical protein
MLTSQTFLYQTTFKKARTDLLNTQSPPEVLCDTGFGVLDGAKVITAATVLRKQSVPNPSRPCVCIRMFQEREDDKEMVLIGALRRLRVGEPHNRVYLSSVDVFQTLPHSVYSYWVPPRIAGLFLRYPPLDRDVAKKYDAPKLADAKQGLVTGDDPRFVRYHWEVTVGAITAGGSPAPKCWAPYSQGGWLDAYQADVDCVVDWSNNGEDLKATARARVQNEQFYFLPGISWHKSPQYPSNQRRINARYLPPGTIFTVSVNGLFPKGGLLWEMLGYLNSELVFYLVRMFELRQVLNGCLASLPFPMRNDLTRVGQLARSAHLLLLSLRAAEECSPFFVAPALLLVLRPPDRLGQPVGHLHSRSFSWPNEEEAHQVAPEAAALFARIYAKPGSPDASLRELTHLVWHRFVRIQEEVQRLQEQIDAGIYEAFNIGNDDRRLISEEIAFRQCQPDFDQGSEETESGGGESDEPDIPDAKQAATQSPSDFLRDQVARLLSYAVKLVLESDPEGVVPIARVGSRPTLAEQVKRRLADWFGADQVDAKWAEAADILGKSVEDWLAQDFFAFHVDLYRRRPIFWQLTSAFCLPRSQSAGVFSCLLHYHKLRRNTLQNVLSHYVAPLLEEAQAQYDATSNVLKGLEQRGAPRKETTPARAAVKEADARLRELQELARRLRELDTGGRPVTPTPAPDAPWLRHKIAEVTGGPAFGGRGWLPVIDYGVRVNIEPLKVARVLPRAADRIE